MSVTLRLQSVDDEPELKTFDTLENAIAYAEHWFVEGYDNETLSESHREDAREYAKRIAGDLRSRGKFICNNFYEEIAIVTDDGQS